MLFDCIDVVAPALAALRQLLLKPTPYGIDLKNPFTMSKTLTNPRARATAAYSGSVFSSSLGYAWCVTHCARSARQPRQSRALWAGFSALAVLAHVRISFR